MSAAMKRSFTGTFGFSSGLLRQLEEAAAETVRVQLRRSPVPPTPKPPPPPEDEDEEPASLGSTPPESRR